MTEKKPSPFIDTSTTSAYLYQVTMMVQVLAPSKELADAKLDQDGGYVSNRDVKFVRSTLLYNQNEFDTEETEDEQDED